jgi:plastocyanin
MKLSIIAGVVSVAGVCVAAPAVAQPKPAPPPPGGKVTGRVTVTEADGKPVTAADVIVYVVGFDEPGGTGLATIQQKGRKFVPDLVAITKGDSVDFPNEDSFLHNVFSQSPPRRFDLGSFKKGDHKQKQFDTTGVVDVYCNIHPEMAATILVLPNKKHTRADTQGRYVLEGVPPGEWTLFAYTRRAAKPVSAHVTVKVNTETSVDLALVRGTETPHTNKFGEKYHDNGTGSYPK